MAISSQLNTIVMVIAIYTKDVGLIFELNTFELMMFFSALHHMHMPIKMIRMKMQVLVELLEIPSLHQRIGTVR